MGLANHQYIIIVARAVRRKKQQAHLHILANRVSSGELYRDNWIGKRQTEAANAIAKERNFVQSQDIGKANKAEIKEAVDGRIERCRAFDFLLNSRKNLVREVLKFGSQGKHRKNLTATTSQPRSGTEWLRQAR
ncbi:relaxase/mobilization nuclease domain-containing protein [Bacteroides salyersiae]|nr:relaxase/mobilization nuclease domain-containing protein [Bacteroides salyersiae]